MTKLRDRLRGRVYCTKRIAIRPGFETVSSQHAARAQQRSYLFHAESLSTTPKSSKEKKGAAGRVIHGNVVATLSRKCRRKCYCVFIVFPSVHALKELLDRSQSPIFP